MTWFGSSRDKGWRIAWFTIYPWRPLPFPELVISQVMQISSDYLFSFKLSLDMIQGYWVSPFNVEHALNDRLIIILLCKPSLMRYSLIYAIDCPSLNNLSCTIWRSLRIRLIKQGLWLWGDKVCYGAIATLDEVIFCQFQSKLSVNVLSNL